MMTYWLVTVHPFHVQIESVNMLLRWDWSCEIEGVVHCYRVTSGLFNIPPNGNERAQIELMYHAKNLADGAPIQWRTRDRKPAVVKKLTKEAQAKMKRTF